MIFIIACFHSIAWPTLPAESLPINTQEKAFQAVVRVSCANMKSVGSGIILGSREKQLYVLTAAHLFGIHREGLVEGFTQEKYPNAGWSYPARIIYAEKETDLAVIRCDMPQEKWHSLPIAKTMRPRDYPKVGWQFGCEGGNAPTAVEVMISGRKLVERLNQEAVFFWQTQPELATGRSGGAIINHAGEIIGIASGMQENRGYCVHLEEIRASLVRNKQKDWLERSR